MNEGNLDRIKQKKYRRIKRNSSLCKDRSNGLSLTRPLGPLLALFLAALLLCCNVLWLYSSDRHVHTGVCSYESVVWGSQASNDSSPQLDYQRVQGSGSKEVALPSAIPNDTVLLGASNFEDSGEKVRFMTIGISSVWRKDNYLYRTLDSIFKETSEEEKLDIYVFLLLADADPHVRIERAKAIEARYRPHLDSGLLRVLQPPSSLYPSIDFSRIRRTYSDSVERVQWRTKQVLDFVFLFWYSWTTKPSLYYLILEDDVLCAKHFTSAAKDFVQLHKKHHWVSLQLAGFLGIGQLVRCKDLERLVSFLLLFYTEHPVDILFNHWVSLMAPDKPPVDKPTRRVPGLFQHIGVHSTLANKTQTLRDSTFSLVKRRFSHVNPSADVVTTIRQYKSFAPELAYSSAPGMFWGIPRHRDTLDIVFPQPLQLARLFITTGTFIHNKRKVGHLRDKLMFGHVEVSSEFLRMETPKRASCADFTFLKAFKGGEMDFRGFPELFPEGVQCIRVSVDPPQKTWVAISEIAVFTMDEANLDMHKTLKTFNIDKNMDKNADRNIDKAIHIDGSINIENIDKTIDKIDASDVYNDVANNSYTNIDDVTGNVYKLRHIPSHILGRNRGYDSSKKKNK